MVKLRPIEMTTALTRGLATIDRRVVAPWTAAKPRITTLYAQELERRLQQDTVDELVSLFDQLGDEVSRLIIDLTPALQSWAIGVERWHRGRWSRNVLAGTNVDISFIIGPQDAQETIETFLARNTALIRDISNQTRSRISDLVYRGLQQRTPSNVVGREISRILGLARRRANRIASDQANKLASALDAQRQREAGLTVWQWNHSGKLHFRPTHKSRDGKLYADDPADRGTAPNGQPILEPPESDDLPGTPPFCGCIRQGVLLLDEPG